MSSDRLVLSDNEFAKNHKQQPILNSFFLLQNTLCWSFFKWHKNHRSCSLTPEVVLDYLIFVGTCWKTQKKISNPWWLIDEVGNKLTLCDIKTGVELKTYFTKEFYFHATFCIENEMSFEGKLYELYSLEHHKICKQFMYSKHNK